MPEPSTRDPQSLGQTAAHPLVPRRPFPSAAACSPTAGSQTASMQAAQWQRRLGLISIIVGVLSFPMFWPIAATVAVIGLGMVWQAHRTLRTITRSTPRVDGRVSRDG